jgi:hypothetical protein
MTGFASPLRIYVLSAIRGGNTMRASRRNFLKTFSALPLALLWPCSGGSVSTPPHARSLLLNCFSIAGFQYYGGPALLRMSLPVNGTERGNRYARGDPGVFASGVNRRAGTPKLYRGCPLNLLVEPDNPYDHFAVAIYIDETKLGYVPRSDNKHISRLLDQDVRLECRIIEVNPDAAVWNMVRVDVFLVV